MAQLDFSEFDEQLQEQVTIALCYTEGNYESLTGTAARAKSILAENGADISSDDIAFISRFLSVNGTYLSLEFTNGTPLQSALTAYFQLSDAGVSDEKIEEAAKNNLIDDLLEHQAVTQPVENDESMHPLTSTDPLAGVKADKGKLLTVPYTPMDNVKEQVDLVSGGLEYTVTDVVLPGVNGLDVVISRKYNSLEANYYTDFAFLTEKDQDKNLDCYGAYTKTVTKLYRNEDGTFTSKYENTDYPEWLRYNTTTISEYASARNRIYETDTNFYGDFFKFKGYFTKSRNSAQALGVSDIKAHQESTPQTTNEYLWDLGAGWSFGFSHMELDPQFAGTGHRRVCLSDGREFVLSPNATNELGEYFYEDVICTPTSGTMNGEALAYLVTYADGKKEYFSDKGFLLRTEDRFGNAITYSYDAPTNGERRGMTITDSLGQVTRIYNETTADGFNKIVELPDGEKITYVLKENTSRKIPYLEPLGVDFHEYNLVEAIDQENQKTCYSYSDEQVGTDILSRVKGPLEDGTYACDPYNALETPNQYPNQYDLTYYKMNYFANLQEVTYPTGAKSVFSYNRRWNNWLEIGLRIDYAIAGRYTLLDGDQKCDEIKYFYAQQYWYPERGLLDDIYNWDGYYHREGEYAGKSNCIVINEVDTARDIRTKYVFDLNGYCESVEVYRDSDDTLLRETRSTYRFYEYFYHPSVTSRKTIVYNTSDGKAQETTECFDYDRYGNEIARWTTLAEGQQQNEEYKVSTTYDYTYNIPLTSVYKIDENTTVRTENILTSDRRNIAQTMVYENDVLVARSDYDYDSFGNRVETRVYTSFSPMQYNSTTYDYREGAFLETVTIDGIVDADGNAVGSLSQSAIKDLYGRIITETDGNGNTTEYYYDQVGRIKKIIYPDAAQEIYEYDTVNNQTTVTDPLGNQKLYQYDQLGREIGVYELHTDGTKVLLSSVEYDAVGRKSKETTYNGSNRVDTIYQYDYQDNIIDQRVLDQDGHILSHESYVRFADKTQKTVEGDASSPSIVTIEYTDKHGRTVKSGTVIDGVEVCATYTYNYIGWPLEEKSARANSEGYVETFTKKYEYNYAGKPTKIIDVLGNTITMEYDCAGQKVSVTDPIGNASDRSPAIRYRYDAAGRLIAEETLYTDTDISELRYYYDPNGNIIKTRRSNGSVGGDSSFAVVEYTYDSRNRVIQASQGGTVTASYVYDKIGQTLEVHTGIDQITKYTYDCRGNQTSYTDPLGKTETMTYDFANNLIAKTDRNGTHFEYRYDGLSRELQRTASSNGNTTTESKTYTMTGELRSVTNENGTITYSYNDQGRLAREDAPGGISQQYQYDTAGNITSCKTLINGVEQKSTTYQYDKADRLASVFDGNTLVATYRYDLNGNRNELCYSNGLTTDYAYNRANKVTELINKNGNTVLSSYRYTYYLDGNQETKTDLDGTVTRYGYDALGRLAYETQDGISHRYEYDAASNRTKLQVDGAQTYTVEYSYDKNNRLLLEQKTAGGVEITTAYRYDPNGNLLSLAESSNGAEGSLQLKAISYEYDVFGRQIAAVNGDEHSVYAYRSDGLRLSKTVDGITTGYSWEGQSIGMELGEDGQVIDKYTYGVGLLKSLDKGWYLYNAHGDVVQLIDNMGAIAREYSYDAFGNEINPSGSDSNPYRYGGHYFDEETGSYYLLARNYLPVIGRFLQPDPHWNTSNMVYGDNPIKMNQQEDEAGLSTYLPDINAINQSGNLYVYCMSNPVMYKDSNGKWIHLLIGAGVGFVVGGVVSAFSQIAGRRPLDVGSIMISAGAGALSGILAATGVGLVGQIAGNAVIGGAAAFGDQMYTNRGDINRVDLENVMLNALFGAIGGYVGGAGGGSKYLMSLTNRMASRIGNALQYQSGQRLMREAINAIMYYIKSSSTLNINIIKGIIKSNIPQLPKIVIEQI